MGEIHLDSWRDNWRDFVGHPDEQDRRRERAFLEAHARYGASIHVHASDVLYAALADERNDERRHTLTLRLFSELANALESLGAWGWCLQRRNEFRLFLDGFVSYPLSAVRVFFREVLDRPMPLHERLALPPRDDVIRALRDLIPTASAREAGEYLDGGTRMLAQAAEEYFADDNAIARHYNRAKHGTSMVRMDEHTHNEFDFQVIAPERRRAKIEEGYWYNIGEFSADSDFVDKLHNNVGVTTEAIRVCAWLPWALYRRGEFYAAA